MSNFLQLAATAPGHISLVMEMIICTTSALVGWEVSCSVCSRQPTCSESEKHVDVRYRLNGIRQSFSWGSNKIFGEKTSGWCLDCALLLMGKRLSKYTTHETVTLASTPNEIWPCVLSCLTLRLATHDSFMFHSCSGALLIKIFHPCLWNGRNVSISGVMAVNGNVKCSLVQFPAEHETM